VLAALLSTSACVTAQQDPQAAVLAAGGSKDLAAAIQGAMLLSAALPHDDGPKPSLAQVNMMQQAAPLIYDSYSLINSAETNADAALQQMKTQTDVGHSASGISEAEMLLQRAKGKASQGGDLMSKAVSGFQNDVAAANPMAPQPAEPKEWTDIESAQRRTRSKLSAVEQKLEEAKRNAKDSGISLISVSQEETAVLKNDYQDKQDDKLLDFLSHY